MWKAWFLPWALSILGLLRNTRATCPSKQELIDAVPLDQELEGVHYRDTFRSSTLVQAPQGERTALSATYYLDESSSTMEELEFVRQQFDETLHYHMGNAMTIYQISPLEDTAQRVQLGSDVLEGHVVQHTVPAGTWYTSSIANGNDAGNSNGSTLLGSVVAPGWEAQDREVANATEVLNAHPQATETIASWLAANDELLIYCDAENLPKVDELVDLYDLQPHPEGGYFLETFRSSFEVEASWGNRSALTAIYYLMTSSEDTREHSDFHRLTSDETWAYYFGDPVLLYLLNSEAEGDMEVVVLGTNLTAGEQPQYTVPTGVWFGAEVSPGGTSSYAFVGTNVGPGFDFADWELGVGSNLVATYPDAEDTILRLTPPSQEDEEQVNDGASDSSTVANETQSTQPAGTASEEGPQPSAPESSEEDDASPSTTADPGLNEESLASTRPVRIGLAFAATLMLSLVHL